VIDIWSSHHNEKVWGPDVEEFRPERFDEAESRGRHPFAFCPFSLGSRNCVGQHLALLEGQVVLGYLLRHYTIRLMPNHPSVETLGFLVPVRPENGVFIVVEPRNPATK
jgi:cytochrome P450